MTSRKRKSLSSILKTQSPSRMALVDLNPNVDGPVDETTTHFDIAQKKKRRSSRGRRVSFAETYQVKEFVKDSARRELDEWHNGGQGSVDQQLAVPAPQQEDIPSGSSAPAGGVSIGPGHHIQGLETLLSGPIKAEAFSMNAGQEDSDALEACTRAQAELQAHQANRSDAGGIMYPSGLGISQQATIPHKSEIKSSFLKSFMAADPPTSLESQSNFPVAAGMPCMPSTSRAPSQWSQQGGPGPASSFKSSFLQALMADEPSTTTTGTSEVAVADSTQLAAPDGMEFTTCMNPGDFPGALREDNGNRTGDITRIFRGQGFEDGNGMDMTACMGGLDSTAAFRKGLDRPAAESTRIFGADNTENMDLTACIQAFEGNRKSSAASETHFDFTGVFGKMTDSAVGKLPDESTGKLLGQIDDLLAEHRGSMPHPAESLPPRRGDVTRKSIVLDTIQEMSSNASSLNVTAGNRSVGSGMAHITPLDACAEEDDMDMTCNTYPAEVKSGLLQKDQNRTAQTEETVAMEMTCAMGQPLSAPTPVDAVSSSIYQEKTRSEDCTRMFHSASATAAMDLTCAGGLPLPANVQSRELPVPSASVADCGGDQTKVFDTDVAAMEMTCTLGQPVPVGREAFADKENHGDNTRMFDPAADDTAKMEMTCAMGQPISVGRPALPDKENLADATRVFDSAANMDMTCAVGLPLPSEVSAASSSLIDTAPVYDQTKVFDSANDDNAAMEMTCTFNDQLPSQNQSATVSTSFLSRKEEHVPTKKSLSNSTRSFSNSEGTTHLQVKDLPEGLSTFLRQKQEKMAQDAVQDDKTENMALPSCLGQSQTSAFKVSQGIAMTEKTCYFNSNNAANMEMTECLGKPMSSLTPASTGQMPAERIKYSFGEETQFFKSDDTANMDFTACISTRDKSAAITSQVSSKIQSEGVPERTRFYQASDSGGMELTRNHGVISVNNQVKTEAQEDKTQFFQSDDTARMDITTCLTKPVPQELTLDNNQQKRNVSGEDQTCMEGVSSLQASAGTVDQLVLPTGEVSQRRQSLPDHATADMDITTGMGGSVAPQHMILEAGVNHERSEVIPQDVGPMEARNDQHGLSIQSIETAGQVNVPNESVCVTDLNTSEVVPQEKTSDTYTLGTSVIADSEQSEVASPPPKKSRSSDTFTIDTSCAPESNESIEELSKPIGTNASVVGEKAAVHSDAVQGEELMTDAPADSSEATGGSESSQSPDSQDPQAAFVLQESLVLPDWVTAEDEKGILDELPLEDDNTEVLCLTAPKESRLDQSHHTRSHMDMSALTSDLSHVPVLSTSGIVPISLFLEMYCDIMQDVPLKKQSIMVPQRIAAPESLAGQLEDACITKPKADMFEWAVTVLPQTLEEIRSSVKSLEAMYTEENAAIIKEIQNASPEESAVLTKKINDLQKYCHTCSKAKMKEWRLKMVTNTQGAMEDSLRHLEHKISKVTASSSAIREELGTIKSVERELDNAIANLETFSLPTKEEKAEWLANSDRLKTLQAELGEKEQVVKRLESERNDLETEKEKLERVSNDLEAERDLLSRLKSDSMQVNLQLGESREEIAMLHRFQEWKLEAFNEDSFKFSFLCQSVRLHIKYENCHQDAKVTELSVKSLLAGDACASARLAHSMLLGSVNTADLKLLYPTRADLSQLMQYMAESVSQVRLLEREVSRLDFWHPVTADHNRLSVKFSSVKAHVMFLLHLDLVPGQYPVSPIPSSCTVTIGSLSEASIKSALDEVKPGWGYISRLTNALDNLIKNHQH